MSATTEHSNMSMTTEAAIGPKPKRPLSTYNYFFQSERNKLLSSLPVRSQGKPRRSHGKCGFSDMARIIAKKWNEDDIDPQERIIFEELARKEKLRYDAEMLEYNKRKKALKKKQQKVKSPAIRKHKAKRSQPPCRRTQTSAPPPKQQESNKSAITAQPSFPGVTSQAEAVRVQGGSGMDNTPLRSRPADDVVGCGGEMKAFAGDAVERLPPSVSPVSAAPLGTISRTTVSTTVRSQFERLNHDIARLAREVDDECAELFIELFLPRPSS